MHMHFLVEQFGWLPASFLTSLVIFLRYALFAGIGYAIFYGWKKRKFVHRKIQEKLPSWKAIRHEIGHSLVSAAVFSLVVLGIYGLRLLGWSRIYLDITEYGWWYLLLSIIGLVIIHDAYFYWMHRAMHHPKLFRIFHLVHHRSNNPTPWASLAFHPLEALAEIAILPLLVVIMPLHPVAIAVFALWSLSWNVIGHLGYELFPAGWVDHPILKWLNTSTHHNMHHKFSKGNYGLYFNWWDHWMGTNHPEYKEHFRTITEPQRSKNSLSIPVQQPVQ